MPKCELNYLITETEPVTASNSAEHFHTNESLTTQRIKQPGLQVRLKLTQQPKNNPTISTVNQLTDEWATLQLLRTCACRGSFVFFSLLLLSYRLLCIFRVEMAFQSAMLNLISIKRPYPLSLPHPYFIIPNYFNSCLIEFPFWISFLEMIFNRMYYNNTH